jgi:hypothetical protein
MALFLIKRYVGEATQTEVDAAIFRAMSCAYQFDGMRWVTSYWDKEGGYTYCVYEAESKEHIQEHARRASLTCDEVFTVSQLGPEQYPSSRTCLTEEASTV